MDKTLTIYVSWSSIRMLCKW